MGKRMSLLTTGNSASISLTSALRALLASANRPTFTTKRPAAGASCGSVTGLRAATGATGVDCPRDAATSRAADSAAAERKATGAGPGPAGLEATFSPEDLAGTGADAAALLAARAGVAAFADAEGLLAIVGTAADAGVLAGREDAVVVGTLACADAAGMLALAAICAGLAALGDAAALLTSAAGDTVELAGAGAGADAA